MVGGRFVLEVLKKSLRAHYFVVCSISDAHTYLQ